MICSLYLWEILCRDTKNPMNRIRHLFPLFRMTGMRSDVLFCKISLLLCCRCDRVWRVPPLHIQLSNGMYATDPNLNYNGMRSNDIDTYCLLLCHMIICLWTVHYLRVEIWWKTLKNSFVDLNDQVYPMMSRWTYLTIMQYKWYFKECNLILHGFLA